VAAAAQGGPSFGAGTSSSISWLDSTSYFTSPAESSSTLHAASGDNNSTVIEAATTTQEQLPSQAAEWSGTLQHRDGEVEQDLLSSQQDDGLVGRVSLVVDHCDNDTLGCLLKIHRELRGRGKLQIEHEER
jgi:hypothetical protein